MHLIQTNAKTNAQTSSHNKWLEFPNDYRAEAVAEILQWVALGESGVAIGNSGTGKSNIAVYLANRPDVVGAVLSGNVHDYCFLTLDINGLPGITTTNFYRRMLFTLQDAVTQPPSLVETMETIINRAMSTDDLSIKLVDPFVADLGVDPLQPNTVLKTPLPATIAAIQASWQYVKKQADIALVIDVSGSMKGEKLTQAKLAAHQFLDQLTLNNRVALFTFSDKVNNVVPLRSLEQNGAEMREVIDQLEANGATVLYDAVAAGLRSLQRGEDERMRAVIVLSDGQDTSSSTSLRELTQIDRGEQSPLLIFPVAYGGDSDIAALNTLARYASTKVLSGDETGIQALFNLLSSYF